MNPLRRFTPPGLTLTDQDRLATIAAHAHTARESIEFRNQAIRLARGLPGISLADIAKTAGLGVSRVKQMKRSDSPYDLVEQASGPPILDLDLPVRTSDNVNRVWGIRDLAPDIPTFESEHAFLTSDGKRFSLDLGWDFYDADRSQRFLIGAVESSAGGVDVYAVTAEKSRDTTHAGEGDDASPSGPCFLLGNILSWPVLENCLLPALPAAMHRPGALAWVHMRIRFCAVLLDSSGEPRGLPAVLPPAVVSATDSVPQ